MWGIGRFVAAFLTAAATAPAGANMESTLLEDRCSMAEFSCRSEAQCVPLDKYCDGARDCEDGSDEPTGCTPCNRTYYGRIGSTYTLQVARPHRDSLPHFCQLTFIASGLNYGDLVQLSIERLNLGRFLSHTKDGCPDAHLQIEELSRPLNKGYWCGTSLGTNTFYSESSAVTMMIRVFNMSEPVRINPAAAPTSQDSIILRLTYRFMKRYKAFLRYGAPYSLHYRGKDVLRTFCDKTFEDCNKKNCKVQSPNFPGMYPRNLTCYYRIKQTQVPAGKVPLIRVKQSNPHLIYIKHVNAPHLIKDQRLYLNDECHILFDYLMIFDGNSTQAPALLKACKGGTLSPVTSSGPELLILFHASAFDFPFQDSPLRKVFGFVLDIEILFVDIESTAYVRQNKSVYPPTMIGFPSSCQWLISSRGQRNGFIQAPLHSLLPNTTCVWRLSALPTEVVWLYFLHYRNLQHPEIPVPQICPNTLSIHDGDVSLGNSTLLKRICQSDKFPKVCSGVHKSGTAVICPPEESYISQTKKLSITLQYAVGTVPAHVEFLARYEFVSKRQWGQPLVDGGICDRIFRQRPDRLFASPRDVFMFGRGGRRRLTCTYVFKAEPYQRISIRVLRSRMGESCTTIFQESSKRYECSHDDLERFPSITMKEVLWKNIQVTRACICDITDPNHFHLISYTNEVTLVFNIPHMLGNHDFSSFFFEGDYEFLDAPLDSKGHQCKNEDRLHSSIEGNFTIGAGGLVEPCASLPRLVLAHNDAYIFMKVKGFIATNTNCKVASRINIYESGGHSPISSVCPEPVDSITYVFSKGWSTDNLDLRRNHSLGFDFEHLTPHSKDLLIEYVGNYSGKSLITWVAVWQILHGPLRQGRAYHEPPECKYSCTGIRACLPVELWCDGYRHCPSGFDEGVAACGLLAAFPWASLVAAGALVISLVTLLFAVIIHKISMAIKRSRKNRRRRQQKTPPSSLPIGSRNNFGGGSGKNTFGGRRSSGSTSKSKGDTEDLLTPIEDGAW